MSKTYGYSSIAKLKFYLSYFFYKLILPFEVKSPKFKLWAYEFAYSMMKFKDYNICIAWKHDIDRIVTRFGSFKIRLKTSDAVIVSPAFERMDLNYIKKLINKKLSENKKVLFIDIGGDIGSYSVFVANNFKGKDVSIKCFEPIEASWKMIENNIHTNGADEMFEMFPYALFDTETDDAEIKFDLDTPGSSSMKNDYATNVKIVKIKTRRLDKLLGEEIKKYDSVICKIDVEGVEKEVVKGMSGILENEDIDLTIMTEDFVGPEIVPYLQENNWKFITKLTTYNSWWKR